MSLASPPTNTLPGRSASAAGICVQIKQRLRFQLFGVSHVHALKESRKNNDKVTTYKQSIGFT